MGGYIIEAFKKRTDICNNKNKVKTRFDSSFLFFFDLMHYEGVCANAGPHSQKLHGRVTNICRNRMRQQYRSAMVPPQHEPTSCQIDVVSSRQVSMLKTVLLTVLNYYHMLGFACSHITLDTHQVSFNSIRTASLIRHSSFRG